VLAFASLLITTMLVRTACLIAYSAVFQGIAHWYTDETAFVVGLFMLVGSFVFFGKTLGHKGYFVPKYRRFLEEEYNLAKASQRFDDADFINARLEDLDCIVYNILCGDEDSIAPIRFTRVYNNLIFRAEVHDHWSEFIVNVFWTWFLEYFNCNIVYFYDENHPPPSYRLSNFRRGHLIPCSRNFESAIAKYTKLLNDRPHVKSMRISGIHESELDRFHNVTVEKGVTPVLGVSDTYLGLCGTIVDWHDGNFPKIKFLETEKSTAIELEDSRTLRRRRMLLSHPSRDDRIKISPDNTITPEFRQPKVLGIVVDKEQDETVEDFEYFREGLEESSDVLVPLSSGILALVAEEPLSRECHRPSGVVKLSRLKHYSSL